MFFPLSDWPRVTRPSETTLSGVMYGETLDRCRNRQHFYFTWYLPRNGSSKTFHETDHITRCNACWNLFHSAAAHKFHLKASKCNSGLINEIACCATCKKACVKPGLHVVASGGFHFSYKARSPYSRLCRTCCPTGMTVWKQHRRTGQRGEPPPPPHPHSQSQIVFENFRAKRLWFGQNLSTRKKTC